MDKINIQALMRERDRLFKRYCNENNPTLKVSKHSKYKNARKKKKISKKEHCQNYFQKHSKNVKKDLGPHQINCNIKSNQIKPKDKTTSNSLMINGNVIINKNCIA